MIFSVYFCVIQKYINLQEKNENKNKMTNLIYVFLRVRLGQVQAISVPSAVAMGAEHRS